jgi:hypothetical protein
MQRSTAHQAPCQAPLVAPTTTTAVHSRTQPQPSASHLSAPLQAWQRRAGTPPPDDWEIDISQLQIDAKVASGSFSNLYKGSYCGQEVAIKILKDVAVSGAGGSP